MKSGCGSTIIHEVLQDNQKLAARDDSATMPLATTCTLHGREIGIEEALQIRDARRRSQPHPAFLCRNCVRLSDRTRRVRLGRRLISSITRPIPVAHCRQARIDPPSR